MILVHRLSGDAFHLNADLIETVEQTPDTVICLVDGRRIIVQEDPATIIERVQRFRASLLLAADELRHSPPHRPLAVVPPTSTTAETDSSGDLATRSRDEDARFQLSFLLGLLAALLAISAAMFIDGNTLGPLLGPAALILVAPASIGAGIMGYRGHELGTILPSLKVAFTADPPELPALIDRLSQLAETARRHGMLALERELHDDDPEFVHHGIRLLVDGVDEQVARETLNIEVAATDERHRVPIGFFRSLASYAPTFGMIGTIIGLINMLGNLQDPTQLGTGLALALLTTLYGVLLANLAFHPLAIRLERVNQSELAALDMMLDGLLAIHRGATPRALIERLEAYLPPNERIGADEYARRRNEQAEVAAESDEAA